jgi:MFS family permease
LKPILVIYGLMLFCFSSVSAARVALTLHALSLGVQPSAVGALFAAIYLFPLVSSWPIGMVCDRYGSRWLLLTGTLIGACGMVIPYFVQSLPALYTAGMLIGVSFSVYNVALHNLIGILSKSPHERARNFSNVGVIGASTSFLGPMFAGIVTDHAGHAMASLLVGAISLPAAALLVCRGAGLPSAARSATRGTNIREILTDRVILRILAISALVQIAQDLFMFYLPIYGYRLGHSASAIGAMLGAVAIAEFAIRFALPRLVAWWGEERLLAYSFGIAAACYALVPLFEGGLALGVICFMFGLVTGCGQPVTTMLLFSRCAEGRSGETFGVRQTLGNLMRVSGPAVFGVIASSIGLSAVYWISAVMMVAGSGFTHPGRGARPVQTKDG